MSNIHGLSIEASPQLTSAIVERAMARIRTKTPAVNTIKARAKPDHQPVQNGDLLPELTLNPLSLRNRKRANHSYNLNRRYNLETVVGVGTTGSVWKAKARFSITKDFPYSKEYVCGSLLGTHKGYAKENLCSRRRSLVVVKIIKSNTPFKAQSTAFDREFEVIKNVPPHKNLMHVHEVCVYNTNPDWPRFCIIMQPMEGDLLTFEKSETFKYMTMRHKVNIMKQMLVAITHVHNNGFIHHDIKLNNFLISKRTTDTCTPYDSDSSYIVKLTDFSCSVRPTEADSRCKPRGTLGFRAPEQLVSIMDYSTPIDIWAFGVCVFLLCTGEHPLRAKSISRQEEKNPRYEPCINPILRVLGTPSRDNGFGSDYVARFGYCDSIASDLQETLKDTATDLKCSNLLPQIESSTISQRGRRTGFNASHCVEVIEACLQWDPENRPTG